MKVKSSQDKSRCFPSSEKNAVITPVSKKPRLNKNSCSNHRPVSTLSFLLKFIERLVYHRLSNYFSANSLMPTMQSAYRVGFSTETAVCKLMNDLLCARDAGHFSVVILPDLSAAFDTVDHKILL